MYIEKGVIILLIFNFFQLFYFRSSSTGQWSLPKISV